MSICFIKEIVLYCKPVHLYLYFTFYSGPFQDATEIAIILPVCNSGVKNTFNNHRLISMLPQFCKKFFKFFIIH